MLKSKFLSGFIFFFLTVFLFGDQYFLQFSYTKGKKFQIKEEWQVKSPDEEYTTSHLTEFNVLSVDTIKQMTEIGWKILYLKYHNSSLNVKRFSGVIMVDSRGRLIKSLKGYEVKMVQSFLPLPENNIRINSIWNSFIGVPVSANIFLIPVKVSFSSLINKPASRLATLTFSGGRQDVIVYSVNIKIELTGETVFDLSNNTYKYLKMNVKYYIKTGSKYRFSSSAICMRTFRGL